MKVILTNPYSSPPPLLPLLVMAVVVALAVVTTMNPMFVTAQRKETQNSDYVRSVLGMGSNTRGALGVVEYREPFLVKPLANVTVRAWCASTEHVVVIADETNKVYSWGLNNRYQTGHGNGTFNMLFEPTELPILHNDDYTWDEVHCGMYHTIVRDSSAGVALVWGANTFGSAGMDHMNPIKTPQLVTTFFESSSKVFSIRDGAAVWKVDQEQEAVYAIGWNHHSQFGVTPSGDRAHTADAPIKIDFLYKVDTQLKQVDGGLSYSLFLFENGDLYSSGYNDLGRGTYHPAGGRRLQGVKLVASNSHATWIVMNNGEVIAFGDNTCGRVNSNLDITDVRGVSDNDGDIDTPNRIDTSDLDGARIEKISISLTHVVVLTSDKRVFGLGCNDHGQLSTFGEVDDMDHVPTLREFDMTVPGETIKDIIAMNDTTLMLTESGKVYAVGKTFISGYGGGLITPTEIATPYKMDRVYAGNDVSYFLTPYDGELFGSGMGVEYITDLNTTRDQPIVTQTVELHNVNITEVTLSGVPGGDYNVYALESDRVHIRGIGNTLEGQLMCEKIDCEPAPVDPQLTFITLPTNTTIFEIIDSGAAHFAGIGRKLSRPNDIGSYIWGSNEEGQIANQGNPKSGFAFLTDNMVDLCTGDYHTIAIDKSGRAHATGRNKEGQLANQMFPDRVSTFQLIKPGYFNNHTVTRVFCGAKSTFVIVDNGDVYVNGDNTHGQLGLGVSFSSIPDVRFPELNTFLSEINKRDKIVKISSAKHGGAHTLVQTGNGELYGFGKNDVHQIGISDSQSDQHTPVKISIPDVSAADDAMKVLDVSTGYRHSLLVVGRKTCPNDCSNDVSRGIYQGKCDVVVGECVCNSGYMGFDCSQRTCPDPLCSGSGTCDTTRGVCKCFTGFSGQKCEWRRCANNCSGQGQCNRMTGICRCDSGWTGVDCSRNGAMQMMGSFMGLAMALVMALIML